MAMSIGSTLIGGIQDISALLPLLGTEQCEDHISSALVKGYLYAAATPLSIFGSLGMARAGFKAFMACCDIEMWGYVGAKTLADMGFKPQGENLSLIMFDEQNKHLLETRLKDLLRDLHINIATKVEVDCKCAKWNAMMILLTAISSSVSITPYIALNHTGGSSLSVTARWMLPFLRAFGGFLTATMMPIVIQMRIVTLTKKQLANRAKELSVDSMVDKHRSSSGDPESGLNLMQQPHVAGFISPIFPCLLLLLLLGILATIVGYIGCFSVVQNTESKIGPILWLGLEGGLSMIRMILWGLNPDFDDAPPLHLKLMLDKRPSLLDCMEYDDGVKDALPLTRASEFLESITSFAGLVDRFDNPNLTLYYTLMRKNVLDKPSERMLYITIFDHTERTLRIYTQDSNNSNKFYSTKSNAPVIDLEHGILEVCRGKEIDKSNDLIAQNTDIRSMLMAHHQSIMNQIRYTVGDGKSDPFIIENGWTMKMGDTENARERQKKKNVLEWESAVKVGKAKETSSADPCFGLDDLYLKQGLLERKRRLLMERRGEWIEMYMKWISAETRDDFSFAEGQPLNNDISENKLSKTNETDIKAILRQGGKDVDQKTLEIELMLMWERCLMEHLLIYEVRGLEEQLLVEMRRVYKQLVRKSDKARLMKEWRANCWKRLDAESGAMNARMNAAARKLDDRSKIHMDLNLEDRYPYKQWTDRIRKAWVTIIERYVGTPPSTLALLRLSPDSGSSSEVARISNANLESCFDWLKFSDFESTGASSGSSYAFQQKIEMKRRLQSEIDDIKLRLHNGLEHCHEFWSDIELVKMKHSTRKWVSLDLDRAVQLHAPLQAYTRLLKTNKNIMFMEIDWDTLYSSSAFDLSAKAWVAEIIRDMPSLTCVNFGPRLSKYGSDPTDIHDHQHLLVIRGEPTPNQALLAQSKATVMSIHGTNFEVLGDGLQCHSGTLRITVSFFGPERGDYLTLRLLHYSDFPQLTVKVKESLEFQLLVSSSPTTDNVVVCPSRGPSDSTQLHFKPNARNNLTINVANCHTNCRYYLRDIELLDQAQKPYNPASFKQTH